MRYAALVVSAIGAVVGAVLVTTSPWWLLLLVPAALLTAVGVRDLFQPSHSILRYPSQPCSAG